MGCNCKKKGETVARQYYVPATDTEPSKIIETNEIIPVPQTPCLLYTSPSPRDRQKSRMPSSA